MNKSDAIRLSTYTEWADRRLLDACAQLEGDAFYAPRAAFFGSIHGTLNHLLVGMTAWQARMEEVQSHITSLDQILIEDRARLSQAILEKDRHFIELVSEMDDDDLADDLHYRSTDGCEHIVPMHLVITHVVNHATHHRGQVHGMLSQTDVCPPPLDLIYFLLEQGTA